MPQVRFHGLATGGEGVGKLPDGKTIFVPFALPQELDEVEVLEEKKSFARGQILHLCEPSPHRITPHCPFFRPEAPENSCGGCTWQHLQISEQRAAKIQIVRDLLKRVGDQKIELDIEGGEDFGYRNKAMFQVKGQEIGFYKHASHELITINHCPIQRDENNAVLGAIRAVLESDARVSDAFGQILVRVSSRGERVVGLYGDDFERAQIFAVGLQSEISDLQGIFWRAPERGKARVIWGKLTLTEVVNELQFEVEADGFWQINTQMTPRMAQVALDFAGGIEKKNVLDLYCGAGLFALHFAREGAQVWGAELSPRSIQSAKNNAQLNGLRAQFQSGDAAKIARQFKPKFFDTILLDPPRAGAKDAIPALLRLSPRQIIYVSCDPATLARDVKSLTPTYEISRAHAFDLFPQTAHIETILKLEKRASL